VSICPVCAQPLPAISDECPQCGSDLKLHGLLAEARDALTSATTKPSDNSKLIVLHQFAGSKIIAGIIAVQLLFAIVLGGVVVHLAYRSINEVKPDQITDAQSNEIRALLEFTSIMKMTVEMLDGERKENHQLREVLSGQRQEVVRPREFNEDASKE